MIKLIASDIDGTLLRDYGGDLPEELFPMIREMNRRGILFTAASGRQYASLRRLFEPVRDEIAYICENGSLVMYRDEVLSKSIIDRELGNKLIRDISELPGSEVLGSGVHTCYVQPKQPGYADYIRDVIRNDVTVTVDLTKVEEPFIKISMYYEQDASRFFERFQQEYGERIAVATSGYEWMDFIPKGTNKGTAIELLMQKFGIRHHEVMAFGDNFNDRELLESAGESYLMKTGRQELLSSARYTTASVTGTLSQFLGNFGKQE